MNALPGNQNAAPGGNAEGGSFDEHAENAISLAVDQANCDFSLESNTEPEEITAKSFKRLASPKGRQVVSDIHRLLPQAPDAEKGVLGSLLLAPREIIPLALDKNISPDHFHLPANRLIFLEIMALHDEQKPIEYIGLTQRLRDKGQLENAGGAANITELFTFLPTAAMAGYYIEILIEKWAAREGVRIGTELAAKCYDIGDDVWELIEGGHRKLVNMVELATAKRSRLPGLRDLSKMLGANIPPPPPELIAGMLHQGSKLIIGGTSKGRKTFALMDMAISVATGEKWWGLETKKGRVCYINFEIQEAFFAKRADDICRAKGVEIPEGQLMAWTLRGHTEGIERMVADLMVVLLRENFSLIIFDPIYKALGDRDENKAGDVASMLNELEKIAVKTGAAIAFGAHYSKGNQAAKESIDRIGGSGVFARDPDAIVAMTPHELDESFAVEATLRNFAPMPPFVVRWGWPIFLRDDEADPTALKQAKKGVEKVTKTKADLKALVPMQGAIAKNALINRAQEVQIGQKRAAWFLSELIAEGELFEWRKPRPRTNPEILISRREQTLL